MISRRNLFVGSGVAAIAMTCRPDSDTMRRLFGNSAALARSPNSLKSKEHLRRIQTNLLGYPINMSSPPQGFVEWQKEIQKVGIDEFHFNNVGDPFDHSHIPFNTHDLERETIRRFAAKYGFAKEKEWGFISHSGTDSNMHGLYMGKTILEGRSGVRPNVYFTKEAHYSIQILRDLLNLKWVEVSTLDDGSMDTKDLKRKIDQHPNAPALVVATIGTTFKGAIDPIDQIQQELVGVTSYLHLDAALFGGYLPHTSYRYQLAQMGKNHQKRYDSIAVSCHKFFGFASPAGIYITSLENFEFFKAQFSRVHNPEYILQVPGTITCSRDAVKPAEFYYYSSPSSFTRQAVEAEKMLTHSRYLMSQLQSHYGDLDPHWTGEPSNTIYFKAPERKIIDRYALATMNLEFQEGKTKYAHVVVMPHVNKDILDRFLDDLGKRRS